MKKSLVLSLITVVFVGFTSVFASEISFPTAAETCKPYEKVGRIAREGIYYNVKVTLEKNKNKCIYKEKIYQGDDYHMMTCEFLDEQLSYLSNSMTRYGEYFSSQIQKNPIFEAKMTSNSEILNKFLADPKICTITYSKNKVKF